MLLGVITIKLQALHVTARIEMVTNSKLIPSKGNWFKVPSYSQPYNPTLWCSHQFVS